MTDAEPTPADGPEVVADTESTISTGAESGTASTDPDEAMKAKYRDALAHKHGTSGAKRTVHGDKGEEAHSQSTGPSQKMFRRKAGG